MRADPIALLFVAFTAALAPACSSSATAADAAGHDAADADPQRDAPAGGDAAEDAPTPTPDVPPGDAAGSGLVGERPYRFRAPRGYTASREWPLVVLLHGYGASGQIQDFYFGLGAIVDERGFLYATPDGTLDANNRRFWNATDACCDFARRGIDDVAYVTAIIDDMSTRYRVDPRRIYLVGHSNGGFMALRMACERSTRIAAVISLAGADAIDTARCTPTAPVSVLQVHGDRDATILYNGGTQVNGVRYPGAVQTVANWALRNRCGPLAQTMMTLDVDTMVAGAETRIARHPDCMGGAAELWTIVGGGHIPNLQNTWANTIYDWLAAHPRP